MKIPVILLMFLALALSGCSRHYVLTLNNGTKIVSASKPQLKEGTYFFKDATGGEQTIPQGRVREISPGTESKTEANPFKVGPGSAPAK